ncbi:hypothetical protein ACTXHA_28735 [Burkholderia cenocepacia]
MSDVAKIRKKIADRHRARLAELIRLHFGDMPVNFIKRTGINQGELSGLLRSKSFGPVKARNLEEKAGLLPLSLEQEDGQPFFANEVASGGYPSSLAPTPEAPLEVSSDSARALIDAIVDADQNGMADEAFEVLRETLRIFRKGAGPQVFRFDVEDPSRR